MALPAHCGPASGRAMGRSYARPRDRWCPAVGPSPRSAYRVLRHSEGSAPLAALDPDLAEQAAVREREIMEALHALGLVETLVERAGLLRIVARRGEL